jgi:hypothetical protein
VSYLELLDTVLHNIPNLNYWQDRPGQNSDYFKNFQKYNNDGKKRSGNPEDG